MIQSAHSGTVLRGRERPLIKPEMAARTREKRVMPTRLRHPGACPLPSWLQEAPPDACSSHHPHFHHPRHTVMKVACRVHAMVVLIHWHLPSPGTRRVTLSRPPPPLPAHLLFHACRAPKACKLRIAHEGGSSHQPHLGRLRVIGQHAGKRLETGQHILIRRLRPHAPPVTLGTLEQLALPAVMIAETRHDLEFGQVASEVLLTP